MKTNNNSQSKLSGKINKNELYIDQEKTAKLLDDIKKQLDIIDSTYEKIGNNLNKAIEKGMVKNKYHNLVKGWAKKCIGETPSIDKTIIEIDKLYQEDVFNYKVSILDKRIAELEKIIKG